MGQRRMAEKWRITQSFNKPTLILLKADLLKVLKKLLMKKIEKAEKTAKLTWVSLKSLQLLKKSQNQIMVLEKVKFEKI